MHIPNIPGGAVVVGVDGSPQSDRAVNWGADQAALEHRPLLLAHGATFTSTGSWLATPGLDAGLVLQAVEDQGRAQLSAARTAVLARHPDLDIHELFDRRDPRDTLIQLSEHAAQVVVGSRGHGTMSSLVLGSVSLSVALHARCPVVVLRGEARDHADEGSGIVVGTDATSRSNTALEFAFRQAALRAMPLTVLHGYWAEKDEHPYSVAHPYVHASDEVMRLVVAESIAGLEADHPDVKVTIEVRRGLPDDIVVAASESADLLVVGTHPTTPLYDLLIGEPSRALLGHGKCPVVVVPDARAKAIR